MRELFVTDPFQGATPEELSTLAEVADVTTDPQTMVYSRNGTLLAVVEALRQSPLLDAEAKIWDGLNTFLTLLDSHKAIAEMLYTLACSREWHIVLASLRDGRDYVRGETAKMISGSMVPATSRARRIGSEGFGNASPGSAPNDRDHSPMIEIIGDAAGIHQGF